MPDLRLSSNFVAQVCQQVELQQRREQRSSRIPLWSALSNFWLMRRLAFGSAFLLVGFLTFQQYQLAERRELARSVAQLTSMAAPTLEFMDDFRAIEGLSRVATVSYTDESMLLDALK